jgi:hypothetical protein
MPPGEPVPNDLTTEFSRADSDHLSWSVTIVTHRAGDTSRHSMSCPTGQSDVVTCTLSADQKVMTCSGVLNEGNGRTANYVDVYDRI